MRLASQGNADGQSQSHASLQKVARLTDLQSIAQLSVFELLEFKTTGDMIVPVRHHADQYLCLPSSIVESRLEGKMLVENALWSNHYVD